MLGFLWKKKKQELVSIIQFNGNLFICLQWLQFRFIYLVKGLYLNLFNIYSKLARLISRLLIRWMSFFSKSLNAWKRRNKKRSFTQDIDSVWSVLPLLFCLNLNFFIKYPNHQEIEKKLKQFRIYTADLASLVYCNYSG